MIPEDHLRAKASTYPDEVAYRIVDGGSVTFAEWEAESNRLGRALAEGGVRKGDRVSVYVSAPEALRWIVAYSAVHKAGAVAVPTNTRLTDLELERVLAHSGAEVMLVDPTTAPTAHALALRGVVETVLVAPGPEAPATPPWSWGATADAAGTSDPVATFQVDVDEDDLADILYTSGTTGAPKGVAIRHRDALLVPGEPRQGYSGKGWLHASPLFTFAGVGFVYNPMQLGRCGIYQPRFDAARWLGAVSEFRPSIVFLVPSMAQLIIHDPGFATADLSSIGMCLIGSAPLMPSTLRAFQERMPDASVSNSYGMTEAGSVYCFMPKGESSERVGSVGQPLNPGQVRIVDDDDDVVAVGETGEILLKTAERGREYFRDPEATANMWRDGWLHTGDLGHLDADGYLYITGRKKDMIIRGGNNIYAVDVEAVLCEHPAVVEAAVVGVHHDVLGEDVAAAVILAPGSEVTVDELRAHCAERLADYKVPRRIVVVDTLPRNATGKVVKAEVRADLEATAPAR